MHVNDMRFCVIVIVWIVVRLFCLHGCLLFINDSRQKSYFDNFLFICPSGSLHETVPFRLRYPDACAFKIAAISCCSFVDCHIDYSFTASIKLPHELYILNPRYPPLLYSEKLSRLDPTNQAPLIRWVLSW